ncbi:MAG: gamma-glutamyltransferase [Granulosicoccus sp.]
MNKKWFGIAVSTTVLVMNTVLAQQLADGVAPEISTGISTATMQQADNFMISAANPLAAKAGYDVLAGGGNAIDAMVATQMMLGLVEPQSSGLGGGAFLVHYDAENDDLTTYDGRETAPMAATPTLFQDEQGEKLTFWDAVVGGRSVGTPGTVKLMYDTHKAHGSMPWASLLQPAINLAESGFEVSERLHQSIANDTERLSVHPDTKAYFFGPDGNPHPVGHVLKNQAYADTLKAIAKDGASAFYFGPIAVALINKVRNADNPGLLSFVDMLNYTVKQRDPVCVEYRQYEVCGMGPPSSGALTVGQILGLIEPFDLAELGPTSVESWRLIGDASRLAFADRGRYMADSDFVPMPTEGLVSDSYLNERSKLLGGTEALESVSPGEPRWDNAMLLADDESIEFKSTSHFSIVDADGNAVSITTTIENGFGSRLMSGGFLLNNELTDFSFATHNDGVPIANRVEPGKRPRSSMSPTIVLKDGKPYMIVGSPGGSRIIGYVAKTIIAHLDWGMNVQEAINMPHAVNRFGTYDLEEGTGAEALQSELEAIGYEVNVRSLNSGLHAIVISDEQLTGGADPRREGEVMGQ